MTLDRLALSRATLDRAAHRRGDPALLGGLVRDPGTLAVVLLGERAPVLDDADADGARLALLPAPQGMALLDHVRRATGASGDPLEVFLGEDIAGRPHVLLAAPGPPATLVPVPTGPAADLPPPPVGHWAGLREVGVMLDDTGAGLLTTSVAVANWHASHPRCARCGQPTEVIQSGWARQCPACGAEHFPRTDPAVIMSVIDDAGRILLGHQSRWPDRRFSTLAGFVEPGESLEGAVRREVFEESGIHVTDVTYMGCQPWPFPSSLMLGFRARAGSTQVQVDGEELADARWWTRDQLGADVAAREVLLPPRVSIARRLIEDWFGGPILDAAEAWR